MNSYVSTIAMAAATLGRVKAIDTSVPALTVHFVPHTHADVGWLKTVDEYYLGSNESVGASEVEGGVQYIIESVVASLLEEPSRKFTWAEQAFFQRWWHEQSAALQAKVRALVQRKQLTFVDGGWSQHDEGCVTHYEMIENTAFGQSFLREQFNMTPRVAWHPVRWPGVGASAAHTATDAVCHRLQDPFGHTATQAALLSGYSGFDAFYFGRMDRQDRVKRRSTQDMEWLWSASRSLGANGDVLAGGFVGGSYCEPTGLDFAVNTGAVPPVQDDPGIEGNNKKMYVDRVVATAREYASYSKGTHVMFMMGCDFKYGGRGGATRLYANMDKLIRDVNEDGRVKATYSNPDKYTQAKHAENIAWSDKEDDMMPISQAGTDAVHAGGHMYWAGYFTSRPLLKLYSRKASQYLRAARQLQFMADLPLLDKTNRTRSLVRRWEARSDLDPLAAAVALLTHHDAVTGTGMQHVVYDYALHISEGVATADKVVSAALSELLKPPTGAQFVVQHTLNDSVVRSVSTPAAAFQLAVFNPTSLHANTTLRLPAHGASYAVMDAATGEPVLSEVVPAMAVSAEQASGLPHQHDAAPNELLIECSVPPLGIASFSAKPDNVKWVRTAEQAPESYNIENEHLLIQFDPATGLTKSITNKKAQVTAAMRQSIIWLAGNADGLNGVGEGAWMMSPNQSLVDANASNAPCAGQPQGTTACNASIVFVRTPLAEEARITFGSWATCIVRLTKGATEAEFETTVGPVPIVDGVGKEIVNRFVTDINSGDRWRSDSNAYEITQRRKNHRSNYELNVTEPIASNTVPVNGMIEISDASRSFVVYNDRAQGGTSLRPGVVDLWLHRRLVGVDYSGGGGVEPLNETTQGTITGPDGLATERLGPGIVVRGVHRVGLEPNATAARAYRPALERAAFTSNGLTVAVAAGHTWRVPAAAQALDTTMLPANVALLSLEKRANNTLLRLQHRYGVGEDARASQPARVCLRKLFKRQLITQILELGLTASIELSELESRQLRWTSKTGGTRPRKKLAPVDQGGDCAAVELSALEIRTFALTFARV